MAGLVAHRNDTCPSWMYMFSTLSHYLVSDLVDRYSLYKIKIKDLGNEV